MSKVFEDFFSEIQADMVSICLENVEKRAKKIYIYGSYESRIVSSSYYYNINNIIVQRHKLNDAIKNSDKKYDVSIERQEAVMTIINDDIKKLINLCKEYNRPMPTEIKLIYDVEKNSLEADYKYELIYSEDPIKTADDIAEEWFEEIKRKQA